MVRNIGPRVTGTNGVAPETDAVEAAEEVKARSVRSKTTIPNVRMITTHPAIVVCFAVMVTPLTWS
jgi:hypothetical protein